MQWRTETKAIIAAHCKDFSASTYTAKINAAGGYTAYVKSLGGIFTKMCGVTSAPKTVSEFLDHVEYVTGLMAIWGFDYWNGKTRHRWGKGSADAFYPASKKFSGCKGGDIGQLCRGLDGRGRYTNCNYGVDTLLAHMSLKKAATDRIKTWATKYGKPVTNKKNLKPGDLVHFYDKVGSRSNPNTWSGWHHIAIVVANDGKRVWFADFGSRFMNSKTPYHYMPVDTSSNANGEYGTRKWAAIHAFNFTATAPAPKQEEELIKKNTGFMGYNVSPRPSKPQYIVIHYTGAEGTASDNVAYFNSGNRNASADIFVGHQGEILAYNNDIEHQYSWHCGGPIESTHHPMNGIVTNINSIGIELCTKKVGNDWTFSGSTVASAVTVTKHLMQVYGIKADHVVRHYDVTGKACPRVPGWGAVGGDAEWNKFKAKLTTEVTVVPRTIKQGNTGRVVKVWQVIVGCLTVDGKFGAKTKAATMKWQKTHGLTPDGVVGPKTWNAALKLL